MSQKAKKAGNKRQLRNRLKKKIAKLREMKRKIKKKQVLIMNKRKEV